VHNVEVIFSENLHIEFLRWFSFFVCSKIRFLNIHCISCCDWIYQKKTLFAHIIYNTLCKLPQKTKQNTQVGKYMYLQMNIRARNIVLLLYIIH